MTRIVLTPRARLLALVVALLAIAVPASAYWVVSVTSGSQGTATAAQLTAPTGASSVVNNDGTITVSWARPASQLSGASYTVSRTTPAPATTVCTVTHASGTASCTDSSALTPGAAYSYSVTAVIGTAWTSSAVTTSGTTASAAYVLGLSGNSTTAGSPLTVTSLKAVNAAAPAQTLVTYAGSKTVDWTSPKSPDGTSAGLPTSAVTFTNGVADVSTTASFQWTPKLAGSSVSLTATDHASSSVTGSVSASVSAATAAKLAFSAQPASATTGAAFSTQPAVTVTDAYGNTTSSTASVTLAIKTGTGATGAALTCTTNPLAATAGVASFAGCAINKPGTAYQLTASSGTLTAATSNAFDVTGYALIITSPTDGATGTQQKPTITGTGANPTGGTVTLTFTSGNTTVTEQATVAANGGWSFSSNPTYLSPGTTYTLTASQTGSTSATITFST